MRKAKIVKISGPFVEWWAPTYKDPWDYPELPDAFVNGPVPTGPAIQGKDDYLCGDLEWLCERMTSGTSDPDAGEMLALLARQAILDRQRKIFEVEDQVFTVEPFVEVPRLPDSAFAEFEPVADMFKRAYEKI